MKIPYNFEPFENQQKKKKIIVARENDEENIRDRYPRVFGKGRDSTLLKGGVSRPT